MDEEKAITVLQTWAAAGKAFHPCSQARLNWDPVQRLVERVRDVLVVESDRLRRVLFHSQDRLKPLNDPLLVDLGMNRWLARQREESYSDWLQWVIQQIRRPDRVFAMFGLLPPDGWEQWADISPQVRREVSVSAGHVGRSGRLDLWVRYPEHALLVVEVKKGTAESADTEKQAGYEQSLSMPTDVSMPCPRVLLATDAEEEVSHGGFRFRSWADLCIVLRRTCAELLREKETEVVAIAMILSFVGAIEQNLLGFSSAVVKRIRDRTATLCDGTIVAHLAKSL